jgi:hypothetical protein
VTGLVILSWVVLVATILLKWALRSGFHEEKWPGEGPFKAHTRLNSMTREDRRALRQEYRAYLKQRGTQIYDHVLNLLLVLGLIGFVVFGYLADRQLPKHRKNEPTKVSSVALISRLAA